MHYEDDDTRTGIEAEAGAGAATVRIARVAKATRLVVRQEVASGVTLNGAAPSNGADCAARPAADKASDENERMAIALRRSDGVTIGFVQIAGWVARRIVCYVKPGQGIVAGERFPQQRHDVVARGLDEGAVEREVGLAQLQPRTVPGQRLHVRDGRVELAQAGGSGVERGHRRR